MAKMPSSLLNDTFLDPMPHLPPKEIEAQGDSLEDKKESSRHHGIEKGKKGWKDAGHHHWGVRHLLAALLCYGSSHGSLHFLRSSPSSLLSFPLAWISQLYSESSHLH
ncbi:UNVERIFIED_CONTAM: hypothetical protein NCL1_08305 [Trichonephila clavipes]